LCILWYLVYIDLADVHITVYLSRFLSSKPLRQVDFTIFNFKKNDSYRHVIPKCCCNAHCQTFKFWKFIFDDIFSEKSQANSFWTCILTLNWQESYFFYSINTKLTKNKESWRLQLSSKKFQLGHRLTMSGIDLHYHRDKLICLVN